MIKMLVFITILFLSATGCKKDDNGFALLQSGSGASDVDELTITEFVPDANSVIIDIGQSTEFFVAAQVPVGRTISYTWYLNDVVVQSGSQQRFTLTGSLANLGTHVLKLIASDQKNTRTKDWDVKINGAPVITPVTTGTPKVSVGSSINLQSLVSDPNSDSLTYTWLLNGVVSPHLVSLNQDATLTGHEDLAGTINITLIASDGKLSDTYIWTAEVNHFPMACNQLTTGQICTYAGSPNIGHNTNPLESSIPLRINPIAHTQDSLGNLFIADWDASVIWYWNKTAATVFRLGINIPANTIMVVAGTGELNSGPDGIALQSALNRPRGLAFRNSTGTLYISEWSASRVRYVDSTGFIYTGLGGSNSHVDGDVAFNHDCNNPSGVYLYNDNLYVACRSHNRVKRWDLNTDLAYTVYGDGGADFNGMGGDPKLAGGRRPARVFVDSDGIYVTHRENHRVTFINHSGANKTFWASGTPITVNDNTVRVIIGNGGGGSPTSNQNPQSANIGSITGLVVINDLIYISQVGNDDNIYLANNTGAAVNISGRVVNPGQVLYLNHTNRGYNGSGNSLNTARMNDPYFLSVDVLDNTKILVSSLSNRRIREIDLTTETLDDIVGSGSDRWGFYGDTSKPTLEHLFYYPNGLTYDPSRRTLYFTDANNYRIRQVDPYGNIETALGRGNGDTTVENDIPTNAFLRTAYDANNVWLNGLGILNDGSVIQTNARGRNVRLWNKSNVGKTFFDVYIQPDRVSTVAGDPLGYSSGAGNAADGATALSSAFNQPNSIATYNDGGTERMWVADTSNHCIREINSDGTLTNVLGTCGASGNSALLVADNALAMNRPVGITVDPANGNMVISDRNNSKIRYWNRSATAVTIGLATIPPNQVGVIACNNGTSGSSSENIFASSSRCLSPSGVAISNDYICFSNQYRHNVRCINKSDGKINTVAGYPEATPRAGSPFAFEQEGISGTSATLYYPSALVFDENGDLIISDTYNHIVRKLKLSP